MVTIPTDSTVRRPNLTPAWMSYFLRQRAVVEEQLELYWQRLADSQTEFDLSSDAIEAIRLSAIHGGGKRVRGVLVLLVHQLVGGKYPEINLATLLPELPHRGSLIEDDIDDHAVQRDGAPPVHLRFSNGVHVAREASDLLYKAPQQLLAAMQISCIAKDQLLHEYGSLSRQARQGQAMDLAWSQNDVVPSEADYLDMCQLKCAAFEFAICVGAILGEATNEQFSALRVAGQKSAIAFQLRDDLLALLPESEDYGADIRERKKTLPIIHSMSINPLLREHLSNGSIATVNLADDTDQVVRMLNQTGSLLYTQAKAETLINEALAILASVQFVDSRVQSVLREILIYGIQRTA